MSLISSNVVALIYILVIFGNTSSLELPRVLHYYKTTKYTVAIPGWWWTKSLQDGASTVHVVPTPARINVDSTKLSSIFSNELLTIGDKDSTNFPYLATANSALMRPSPFTDSTDKNLQFGTRTDHVRSVSDRNEGSFCRRSFDGRAGYCILAYQCLHVVKDYRLHGTKIDICTYRKNIPVVCCPLADKHVDEQRISSQKCQEYYDVIKNIKINMERTFSRKHCVSSVPMIVGGEVTRSEDYPHMAALGWTENGLDIKWGCGGSLISELFVLTAAHCVTSVDKPPDIVRVGAQNLNETAFTQDIKILVIILHPKYVSSSYYHDIALLKLTKPARFTPFVRPACLWQLPSLDLHSVIATGWGRIEFMGPKSEALQRVALEMIDQALCKKLYQAERRLQRGIIEEQFCAGHLKGGRDTCQGDSGGPLHAELPEFNCVKFIVGITSFGKFCAAPNAPGVYTKVYSYLDWIEKIAFKT